MEQPRRYFLTGEGAAGTVGEAGAALEIRAELNGG
jgi:hypothetical protein